MDLERPTEDSTSVLPDPMTTFQFLIYLTSATFDIVSPSDHLKILSSNNFWTWYFFTFSSSPCLPLTYRCVPGFGPQPIHLKMSSLVWSQSHLIFQPMCWKIPNQFLQVIYFFFFPEQPPIFSFVYWIFFFRYLPDNSISACPKYNFYLYPSKAILLQTYSSLYVPYFRQWKQVSHYLFKPGIWVMSLSVSSALPQISKQFSDHFNTTSLKYFISTFSSLFYYDFLTLSPYFSPRLLL